MTLQAGQTLLHYRVVEHLGKGGMGEVWAAEDTKLGRRVALKLLPPELAEDADRLARFEHEARAVAALNHPNIVTLHSIEEAEGRHFLVMELTTGRTLDQLVPAEGLPADGLFDLAIPLAAAVASAHERGVVHRDLKPTNVMVADDGTLKVLDFGLAKWAAEAQTRTETIAQPLSAPGTVVGTVPYMSPEQAQGRPVDHRSDIFSLGVMLYEMATGARPFRGDNSAEVISAILRDTPPDLSDVRPNLPMRLARIVSRCLEKDPRQRLQSALDLSNELADLRFETSSGPRVPVSVQPTATPARSRSKTAWVGAAAFLVLAAIVVVVMLGRSGNGALAPSGGADPGELPMIVVFPFENLGPPEQDYFAAGVADEITSRLATVESLGVISRTSAIQYDRTGKTMAEIGQELGVRYVLEGTVRWDPSSSSSRVRVTPQLVRVAADKQIWSASYDERLDEIFAVQSDIAERVIAALDVTLGETERAALLAKPTANLDAYQAYLRGRDNSNRDYYSRENRLRTIRMLEEAVSLDPDFALAWAALSQEHSYFYHLRYDATDARRHEAKLAVDRALKLQPDLPEAHLALGFYHYRCFRDYEQAMVELDIAARGLPSDSRVFEAIAAIRRRQGRWDEAISNSSKAGRLDPRDATIFWDLGVTYLCVGRSDDVIRSCDRSIAIDPEQSVAYTIKSMAYWQKHDLASARRTLETMPDVGNPFADWIFLQQELLERDYEAALRRARAFTVEMFQATILMIPRLALQAQVLELMGRRDEARPLWERSLAMLEIEIAKTPEDARAHSATGLVLAYLGRKDAAVDFGKRAVELYPVSVDAFHGPAHLLDLARIYIVIGEDDAAIDLLEQLIELPSGVQPMLLDSDPTWDRLRNHSRFEAVLDRR